ncbi:hypothetical protein M406DRAFT_327323 [Cryphonectria parasitica EP155]|uniref:Uncharacterized protein n=1 Tax=Cryphonectria parasitica (strain ATCC 38755 / EP155) TaxID=660469 RepID=A0A9P4Y9D2_CRYP1|nr:uncharacterized protein M406DRAFT_327323 [Cryphonectria parasitica EP155]KAF3768911.1 hypothetical protein M406DRAFT_327323 [Cryphonectria parasitica EP155]
MHNWPRGYMGGWQLVPTSPDETPAREYVQIEVEKESPLSRNRSSTDLQQLGWGLGTAQAESTRSKRHNEQEEEDGEEEKDEDEDEERGMSLQGQRNVGGMTAMASAMGLVDRCYRDKVKHPSKFYDA